MKNAKKFTRPANNRKVTVAAKLSVKNEAVSTAVIVANLEKSANPTIKKVTDLKIKTKEDFELAAQLIKKLKDWAKEAKAEEDRMTEGLKQSLSAIKNHFKPFRERVEMVEDATKEAMQSFLDGQKKLSERLDSDFESGKIKKVSTVVTKQNELRVTNGSAQIRKVWQMKIIDVSKIPREYMIPDTDAIKAVLKEGGSVAGCVWKQVDSIAI